MQDYSRALRARGSPDDLVPARRILVVDGDQDAARSLRLFLSMSGHDAEAVYDGMEALRTASRFRPEVALVDLDMPDIDGVHLAARLRAQPWACRLNLIAMAGRAREEDFQRAERVSFNAYLLKPVETTTLLRLL